MKKLLGLFLSSVIALSAFAPHRPAHALAAPAFKWNATTLAPNSQQPLASLITTNAKGIRTWRATGSCVRNGPILTVIGTKVCRLQLSIGSRGKPPRITRSRAFRIRAVSADASGTLPVTPSRALTVWYPDTPPDKTSDLWNVPISSYVRGRDVYPLETTLPSAETAACEQATKVKQGVIGLFFGRQVATGGSGFGITISNTDVIKVVQAWATGLARCARGPWELAIGTSNSGGATTFNGYFGGVAWAQLVDAARAVSDTRIIISGANDLEPGWGPSGQARAWVDGFVASTTQRLWNFGSADGCPQKTGGLLCNNGWTIDDVIWVSAQAGPNIVALPQVHTNGGAQSKQWSVIAARAKELGIAFRLAGMSVQTAACKQVRGGCPTTGISAWNAWAQLRKYIDLQPSLAGLPLAAPTDIRWGWGGPFLSPTPTTTTTTLLRQQPLLRQQRRLRPRRQHQQHQRRQRLQHQPLQLLRRPPHSGF
jgi:hypothetical protein